MSTRLPKPALLPIPALLWLLAISIAFPAFALSPAPARAESYDLVVYGGTSSGVVAAVQAVRMGKTACVIHPGKHLGGLTSGGLGATDIGNKAAIGGLSRDFYRRLGKHYGHDENWTFEPHVAEQAFDEMAKDAHVPVFKGERLDLKAGVTKDPATGRIVSITTESGKTFAGKMFIDATYEGDLMAKAGVSYAVGREANSQYDETLDGVQPPSRAHQFTKPVDPYVKPGDPASGLLPGVHAGGPGKVGEADRRVQAYNFRLCLTDRKENQLPFPKPPGYEPLRYELLLRYLHQGVFDAMGNQQHMPEGKTDLNNNGGFSSDNIGRNYDYPDGDYAARDRIFQDHVTYQQGLMWFLANDERVPPKVREAVNKWGLCKDEFQDTGGWGHELYVREARRMVSDYVMTQHNCQGDKVARDPVGLAAYGMDSHNTQRYVDEKGLARNEGDVQVHGFSPYPIAYKSIVPREKECGNLLVPVCLSATHISYGSIRMEPVFMVLGQSAATAACMSIDQDVPVQRVDYAKLRERLLADQQVLEWTGPRAGERAEARTGAPAGPINPGKLPGIVVDDVEAQTKGDWIRSTSQGPFVGEGYLHDGNAAKGDLSVRFAATIQKAGRYEVRLAYTAHPNRADNVPVTVFGLAGSGPKALVVDERETPPEDHAWASLGTYEFAAGASVAVEVSNTGTDGYVVADAVQWLPR